MGNRKLKKLIAQSEQELNVLHAAIKETVRNRKTNPSAWKKATTDFHNAYDRLAFPGGGLERQLLLLKQHDADAIDYAIEYLEENPYFFRSGYIKQEIAHILKQTPLTKQQKDRLCSVFIDAITSKVRRREFREYCRLARVIADRPFIEKIEKIAHEAEDTPVKERALLMLSIIAAK